MIRLRDIGVEDEARILRWRNQPEVARYMFTDHYITPKEHEEWFKRVLNEPSCRYWIIVCDGIDVGLANIYQLDRQNRRCYWAFYVADLSARGKGVGSFAGYFVLRHVFDELHLNKLCSEVLHFNEASVRMQERLGFQQEGLLREHIIKAGEAFDVVALAILRKDWELNKPKIESRLQQKGILAS
jgi:UDP-4-amino-4,6-dideoxy-N-acetyl-beta-L-altrosamine N-acetyltransferase